MKFKLVGFLFFVGCFFVSLAQSNTESGSTITAPTFKQAILNKGIQVLDVRTSNEFSSGHIQNALQANWLNPKEFSDRTQHLNKNQPIFIYCQAGGRSASAQSYLIQKGFKVINLEGGLSNWKMNGFPVEGSRNQTPMRMMDVEKVIASNEYVLIDIGADWCPPCRKMLPVLTALKKKSTHPYYFLAVDGGNDIEVMKALHSEALPTFIIYKKGKEIWRRQGIVSLEAFNAALQ